MKTSHIFKNMSTDLTNVLNMTDDYIDLALKRKTNYREIQTEGLTLTTTILDPLYRSRPFIFHIPRTELV